MKLYFDSKTRTTTRDLVVEKHDDYVVLSRWEEQHGPHTSEVRLRMERVDVAPLIQALLTPPIPSREEYMAKTLDRWRQIWEKTKA